LNVYQKKIKTKEERMTFKRVLFLLVLSVLCISVSAQFASFRTLSTAGLLDDNIEAILAVTEMTYVDGFNIFTNLSNFNYQSEDIFDGYSGNYLIGFKGSMMEMLHLGFLSQSYGYDETDSSYNIYTEYNDNNGDEQYDELTTDVWSDREFDGYNYSTNYLAFAFGKPEGVKAGFSYTNYRGTYDYNEVYVDETRDSNMISGDLTRTYNEWYNYTDSNPYTDNIYSLVGAFNSGAMEFALNLDLGFYKDDYLYHENDSFFEDLDPENAAVSIFETGYYTDDYNYTQNGFMWNLGLKGYYRTTNTDSIEFGGYFSSTNYARVPWIDSYENYYYDVYPGIVDDATYEYRYQESIGDSTSTFGETYMSWGIGGKFVKAVEKAHFAMGAWFGQSKDTYIDTTLYAYTTEEAYNNGDGIDDGMDYTYYESGSYSAEYVYNSLSTYIYLPVGIEYNFWGPITGRLGAETNLSWYNSYSSEKYFDFNPGTYIYTYGDGSVYEYLNDANPDRTDWDYSYSEFDRYTYFSYGMGWEISKNVKLDFMGFSNLTDLTDWSISANVKF